ncbi:MAG TPA: hypothetical protein VFW17_05005 [Ktedonobacterales bacterium]|nr:hypothetical protein [Ktedonobacterales bacterium]
MYEEYDPELYCKLFVDADDISREDLQALLVECLGDQVQRADRWSIDGSRFAIGIVRNDEFDIIRRNEPDSFLYYRCYLDIDAVPSQPRADQISLVTQILECLWKHGYAAVAACDFEDELPRRGGYNPGK